MRDRATGSVLLVAVLLLVSWTAAAAQVFGPEREPMPAFVFRTANGETVRLGDFRGKVVLVGLWTSWCAGCPAELRTLDALAAELDTTQVVALALNDDTSVADAQRFLADQPVRHMRVGFGEGRLKDQLHSGGYPATWVVDRDGRMAGRWRGFQGGHYLLELRAVLARESGAPSSGAPR